MKRTCSEFLNSSTITTSAKCKLESTDTGFSQIFTIARVEKGSTGDISGTTHSEIKTADLCAEADKLRVGVSSKVNFSKLTSKEQLERFKNQAQEIRRLRKKLAKSMAAKSKKPNSEIQKALEKVKFAKHELEDQQFLVENIVKAVNSGVLLPNTLAYNQICTILRNLLGTQGASSKYMVRLPECTVPISTLEFEEYSKLPCTPGVLRALLGKEQRGVEDLSELLRALHLQAFKNIMFSQQGKLCPY